MRFNLPLAALAVLFFGLAGCSPRGVEALRRGDEALAANRPAEAVPLLERAVTDLPNNAVAWNQLGLAYQATGRPDEARKAYLRALQFDRNLFDVHFNLGALEYETSRWADAERALRTYLGIEANRANSAAWRMLAEAQLASGQWDLAERTVAAALQISPNDPTLRHSLGLVYAKKRRWRDAHAQFSQAARLAPEYASARLNLAVATQQLGDRRAALEHYRAYLALNPSSGEVGSVREQILQLESALAPPPAVSTNLVSVRTNPPPVALRTAPPTNQVASVPSRATNPPPLARPLTNVAVIPTPPPEKPVPPTNAAPASPAVPVPPPPTIEIVQVEDPPEFQLARDPVPAAAPTNSLTVEATNAVEESSASPPVRDVVLASANPARAGPPAPEPTEAPPAARRTFWQRMNPTTWGNPLNWFRGQPSEDDADSASTRPPPPVTQPTVLPPRTNAVASEPPPTRAAPPKPVVPRYPRGDPPKLTPGNRTAAEAEVGQLTADRLSSWQRAVELDPSWAAGWQQVGRLALESGRVPLALEAGEAAVALQPGSPAAHQLFAAALARAGFPADAAEELEQAVSVGAASPGIHLALAGLYARDLGEPAFARPHYEAVLRLDPQNPQAGAIRMWLANNPE